MGSVGVPQCYGAGSGISRAYDQRAAFRQRSGAAGPEAPRHEVRAKPENEGKVACTPLRQRRAALIIEEPDGRRKIRLVKSQSRLRRIFLEIFQRRLERRSYGKNHQRNCDKGNRRIEKQIAGHSAHGIRVAASLNCFTQSPLSSLI